MTRGSICAGVFSATLLLMTSISFAQSTLPPGQLRGRASVAGQVYVVLPNGTVALADVGSNLVIDTSSGRPVIKAVVPASPAVTLPTFIVGELSPVDPSNPLSYLLRSLPIPGSVIVYRNGLRQSPAVDYMLVGSRITFNSYYAGSTGDIVVVDYWTAPPAADASSPLKSSPQ